MKVWSYRFWLKFLPSPWFFSSFLNTCVYHNFYHFFLIISYWSFNSSSYKKYLSTSHVSHNHSYNLGQFIMFFKFYFNVAESKSKSQINYLKILFLHLKFYPESSFYGAHLIKMFNYLSCLRLLFLLTHTCHHL